MIESEQTLSRELQKVYQAQTTFEDKEVSLTFSDQKINPIIFGGWVEFREVIFEKQSFVRSFRSEKVASFSKLIFGS